MRKINSVTLLSMITLPFMFVGCGGGASSATTVTIIPDVVESEGSAGGSSTAAAAPEGFGTLKGKVVFKGSVPKLSVLVSTGAKVADAAVCSAQDIPSERLVVNEDGGVANTFIYMAKVPKGVEIPSGENQDVVFDQKTCAFIPHALIVRTGIPFRITNSDPFAHNTHTYPKKNNGSSALVKAGGEGDPMVYAKEEATPFEVKCDLHAWMRAYHLPLSHPYGAVSNENGEFEIPNMPAGKHQLRVWHEAANGGFINRKLKVEIKPDETVTVMIDFPVDKFSGN
jgi:plastocyanin